MLALDQGFRLILKFILEMDDLVIWQRSAGPLYLEDG